MGKIYRGTTEITDISRQSNINKVYRGTTEVWVRIPPFVLSGGTETTVGSDKVHTFTSNGTLTVTGSGTVSILVVGGGQAGNGVGSGTSYGGGGGGGGEVYYSSSYTLSAGTYNITIGGGGIGGLNSMGGNGGDTTVGTLITARGGNRDHNGNNINLSTKTTGGGTSRQGVANYFGGNGYFSTYSRGGNGAGARGNAVNSAAQQSNGFTTDISGSSLMYGCGANGGTYHSSGVGQGVIPTNGQGRDGGTGNGSDASANRGGGGGGGGYFSTSTKGGNGGSGIVIIRYTPA